MKKQLFLASALALVTLASCGGNNGGGIKVGLICLHDKNSTYDANFIQAFEAACEKAKKEGKISGYSYVTDVPEEDACYTAAERFVNQGYSIVFSDSFGHDQYMHKIAKDHPNVFFSSATGIEAKFSDLPNFHNAFASIYEGRFLAGMAAGEYIKEHQDKTVVTKDDGSKVAPLGYVGAFPYAEVISGFTSWFLGVKYALKSTQIKPEMEVTFTKSWYDYDLEAAAAQKLIDKGCKLISQHADSMGAPNVCKTQGIPNVSYNINTVEMDSTCDKTYVAHSRINWEPYYTAVLNTAIGSKVDKEQNWTGTLATNSVEYNVSDLVSPTGKTEIENAKNALAAGTLKVFDTSTFTVKKLDNQAYKDWYHDEGSACPVLGTSGEGEYNIDNDGHLTMMKGATNMYERDTNLFIEENGTSWIQESTFRSAPSFDYIIDDIHIDGVNVQ